MAIFHVLIAFGAFQAFFLAAIFLLKGKGDLPKTLFALFLIIEGFTLVERVLVESNMIGDVPHLLGISYPISFIKPPILFLMGLAMVSAKFSLKKKHLFHFIPFVLILLLNIPFYFQSGQAKVEFVKAFVNYSPTYTDFNFYFFLSFFMYIGIYIVFTIKTLARYHIHVKNNKLSKWYLRILYLYAFSLVISLIYFLVRPSGLIEIPLFNMISMLIMTFLIQSIAYNFLVRSNLLNYNPPNVVDMEQKVADEKKIRSLLENDKLYLEDSLGLEDLAKAADMPKKHVSDIINQRFGSSFKEVINQYRIDEAKELMKQKIDANPQLINIGYASGFNNKVSFYRTFKKHTGKSPSDFFQQLKSEKTLQQVQS